MINKVKLIALILITWCASSQLYAQSTNLFNGKDLTGWEIYGTEKWYVENGILICESGPDKGYGYLGTKETFKNFELTLQFKQAADGNSGVFIRSSIEGTKITEGRPKWHRPVNIPAVFTSLMAVAGSLSLTRRKIKP